MFDDDWRRLFFYILEQPAVPLMLNALLKSFVSALVNFLHAPEEEI